MSETKRNKKRKKKQKERKFVHFNKRKKERKKEMKKIPYNQFKRMNRKVAVTELGKIFLANFLTKTTVSEFIFSKY